MTNWNDVTIEELTKLYVEGDHTDREVAELYGVTPSQASYKRKKLGLTREIIVWKKYCLSDVDIEIYQQKIEQMTTADISKSLVHFIFRNGPVENMHSEGKLSEADMKTLNQYMNNRLATAIYLLRNQDWKRLRMLLVLNRLYGQNWDQPELCLEEIDQFASLLLSHNHRRK